MLKGLVLVCDSNFTIREFLFSSFGKELKNSINHHFINLCNKEEETKANFFVDEIQNEGAAFNWEINIDFSDSIKPLKFSGSKINDDYFIIGLETNDDIPFLYDELMKINNEQSNFIRISIKEKFLDRPQTESEAETYDELSRLNNELANLQRELTRKNIELKKLNELKNQFIGIAAHDLRNPLNVILSYSDFLVDEAKEILDEDHYDFIKSINSSSEFMLRLVEDLLDYTKIETGNINLVKEKNDIVSFISNCIKRNQVLANRKNIPIQFESNTEEHILEFDKYKFEQVINNLLTNAVKFSYPNSVIKLVINKNDKLTLISVIDSGKGISPEHIEGIFHPFNKKASSAGTSGERSTGLGLSISKKIVESHGGYLSVESEVGKGSKFIITLTN